LVSPWNTQNAENPSHFFTYIGFYDRSVVRLGGGTGPPLTNSSLVPYLVNFAHDVHAAVVDGRTGGSFGFSCCMHMGMTTRLAHSMKINGISLVHAVTSWFVDRQGVPRQLIESVDNLCPRNYNCNPTCPIDAGPGETSTSAVGAWL